MPFQYAPAPSVASPSIVAGLAETVPGYRKIAGAFHPVKRLRWERVGDTKSAVVAMETLHFANLPIADVARFFDRSFVPPMARSNNCLPPERRFAVPVSYTHLTLPTIYSV